MKRRYITQDQIAQDMRKPLLQMTCRDRKSNFLYWEVLDDFGDVVKRLPHNTPKDVVSSLGDRLIEVRRAKVKIDFNKDECLL